MTVADAKSIDRTAQPLIVELIFGFGSPPLYYGVWYPLWDAKVDRIEINHGSKSSLACFWLPAQRWDSIRGLVRFAVRVRIRTAEPDPAQRSVLFLGFLTSHDSSFSGGAETDPGFERNVFYARDYRWLLGAISPVVGQLARSPDDYDNYGTSSQSPRDDLYTWLTGRRIIFNADGRPNRDPDLLKLTKYDCEVPIFADPDNAVPWTARDMVRFLLCPPNNFAYDYLPIPDPLALTGLSHGDFDAVLNHIVVDGLNTVEALDLICRNIGFSFREDYDNSDNVSLVFFKSGAASGYSRSSSSIILHSLHAPAVGESVSTAVSQGKKLLWSAVLSRDIAAIVNKPWGLGAPHRFEFTAELVPAWLDSELVPDTADGNANLFIIDADLQKETNPNSKNYYKYYHIRGNSFLRDVGRRWALNESGRYSLAPYARGMPFDFSTVIDSKYIVDAAGRRLFAPFNRRLLPCLTIEKDSLNSIGIKVEFSFDGGAAWQVLPAAISSLDDQCGIYIADPNLAEMVEQTNTVVSGGVLDGVQLNYFTSLCNDKLNARSFELGQWRTRCRVTASVQLDRRLARLTTPTTAYGSPFHQRRAFDFSDRYEIAKRTAASIFHGGSLSADESDSTSVFDEHLDSVRDANQDMSVSGRFTLERLWLGDGSGRPDFAVGDGIERLTGRQFGLSITSGATAKHPEIVRIVYLPESQRMSLYTRDLRYAEAVV